MNFNDISVGMKVRYVHTGRVMTVIELQPEPQLAVCEFTHETNGVMRGAMPPMYLEPAQETGA